MIKHKQNKKTSDIYSLPLKCDLCSTFSIKQTQRTFFHAHDGWSWCQPVRGGGGRHSFQEGRNAWLATCWEYNHVVCLPAVRLLKMTQSKWSNVVLWKWLVCHHISEQTTQESQALGSGKAEVDGHALRWRMLIFVRSEEGSRALQPGSVCTNESSNSQLVVFCLTSDQSCAGFYSFAFYGCCDDSLWRWKKQPSEVSLPAQIHPDPQGPPGWARFPDCGSLEKCHFPSHFLAPSFQWAGPELLPKHSLQLLK